jgi:hypothetical protein
LIVMLRWLLLIPFGLVMAMAAGLVAMMIAAAAEPTLALMVGGGIERLLDILFGLADSGIDPTPTAQAAFALVSRLGFAIIVLPVVLVAVGAELFGLRSGLIQSGSTGLLTALLPLALLGLTRTPSGPEMQVLGALVLVGAASGFVYWLIAGRSAGGEAAARM